MTEIETINPELDRLAIDLANVMNPRNNNLTPLFFVDGADGEIMERGEDDDYSMGGFGIYLEWLMDACEEPRLADAQVEYVTTKLAEELKERDRYDDKFDVDFVD